MTTRRHALTLATALGLTLAATGCDEGSTDNTDFRGTNFWDEGLGMAGNGDVEVHAGTDTSDPGCLIWDLDGGTILESNATSGGADVYPIAKVATNRIETTSGAVVCTAERVTKNFGNVYKLRNAADVVELSLFNRFVFHGDVAPTSAANLMENFDLAYEFDDDQILFESGQVAITATDKIQPANPMRKLVLAGLVDGVCGSGGLP